MNNSSKKILFVVMPYHIGQKGNSKSLKLKSFLAFPYGVLSIATYLKYKISDIDISVFDCNIYENQNYMLIFKAKLLEFKPHIVAFSMQFDISYYHLADLAYAVKQYDKSCITVIGGVAASASYGDIIIEQPYIDAVCFSEGELPVYRLIVSNDPLELLETDVSWVTKKTFAAGKTPQSSFLSHLDEVVDIDYTLIEHNKYNMDEAFSPYCNYTTEKKQFFLFTSRGCPFKCTFCFHSGDDNKVIRYAGVDKIINHVDFLIKNYGMNTLTIYDDQLLYNKNRAKELFRKLSQFKLRIECPNGLTIAYIDDELAMLMRQAGMDTVQLAVESGSSFVLNKLIKKPLNLSQVKTVVEILRKYKFWIQAFFVSGMPGETDKHRNETIEFCKDIGFDWCSFSIAIPSKGSKLWELCLEKGYISNNIGIGDIYAKECPINTSQYSAEYIIEKTYLMNLEINFVNNYRMSIGDYETAVNSFKDVIKRYPKQAFAHYYLSKALNAMGNINEAKSVFNNFIDIVNTDEQWQNYCDIFNIKNKYY